MYVCARMLYTSLKNICKPYVLVCVFVSWLCVFYVCVALCARLCACVFCSRRCLYTPSSAMIPSRSHCCPAGGCPQSISQLTPPDPPFLIYTSIKESIPRVPNTIKSGLFPLEASHPEIISLDLAINSAARYRHRARCARHE